MCVTDSSTTTITKLFLTNETLIEDTNGHKLQSNWFVKVYSHLNWQQEVQHISYNFLIITRLAEKRMKLNKMGKNIFNMVFYKLDW